MTSDRRAVRMMLPVATVLLIGTLLSVIGASVVSRQVRADSVAAFERDADASTREIEREIERHIGVVEDVSSFAEATWPGDINEWRSYLDRRVTGGNFLAFSSTAGLIERVPVDQIDAFEARETETSGRPFVIESLTPLAPSADRLVLSRTGDDFSGDLRIQGLEVTAAIALLGVELPTTSDRLAIASMDEAPQVLLDLLALQGNDFIGDDIVNTNVVFAQAVGPAGEEPLGWVVLPAELGYLLSNAIGELDEGDLNISVSIDGTSVDGDLGRYEGAPGLDFAGASHTTDSTVEFGGWTWTVSTWAGEDYGIGANRVQSEHVLLGGLALTLLFALFAEARRHHLLRLNDAEFEVELQRTLAETDPLTGLANRQGLFSQVADGPIASRWSTDGAATLFLDLNGFKLVNDRQGHAAGDQTLMNVAHAVRGVARDGDLIARLGGDEFVVVCPGLSDPTGVETFADRLDRAIRQISDPVPIGVSIGIAISQPGAPFDFDDVLSVADAAMYKAKKGDDQAATKSVIVPLASTGSVSSARN